MRKGTLGLLTLMWMATACSGIAFEGDPNDAGAGGSPSTGGVTSDGGAGGGTTTSAGGTIASGGEGGAGGSQPDAAAGGQTGGSGGTQPGTGGGTGTSPGRGGSTAPSTVLVTSAQGAFWKTAAWTEVTSNATVTVNDSSAAQKWEGFGGAFNEKGWSYLTTTEMQTQAVTLLFSATEGANLAWGRIPMGASDYAVDRYTCDDTGTDVTPDSSESNRPSADTSLDKFSLARDGQRLIPYINAARAIKPDLRFWAGPWTPPVWMKTGYMKVSGANRSSAAKQPSYFDGGSMKSDATTLTAYAQYYTKFVQGYKDQGIDIEIVSPQNEPGYDQNYPSCLWDKATYTTWIGQYLGPAMKTLGVKVMLGTLSNPDSGKDLDTANAVLADATAKSFLAVAGVQWGVLDKVNGGTTFGGLPIWASEHKCGNYPWCTATGSGCPAPYNANKAPNDLAYAQESWGYIRDAITKGKVTAYNAWNMVLDSNGLGIDTTRDWKQDALLVADPAGTTVTPTPAYYVFRHCSQYVQPGATVVGTSGGDAVAFKNPDGSLVAVLYNSGAANSNYVVAMGGKKLQFAMPASGWATVKYMP